MGQGYLDIILLAAIAVFLVMRLYKVLGRRTGHEQPRDSFGAPAVSVGWSVMIGIPRCEWQWSRKLG